MDKKMSSYPKEESYRIIPKRELKCVWMSAGLISYKLCKYDLQCEKCPLDWELRNLSSASSSDSIASSELKNINAEEKGFTFPSKNEGPGDELLKEDLYLLNIKESLLYHPGHAWVKVERSDEVRVGIDDFLGRMLGKVKAVEIPLPGKWKVQGRTLCSIIQEEGILHIVSPVCGLILSVNQKLKDHPELISTDPLGDGFLLTMRPKDFQRDKRHLCSGEEALSWRRKEWERYKEAVISELHHEQERLGMTMQDGRIKFKDIKKLFGPDQYFLLVKSFLKEGKNFSHLFKPRTDFSSKFQLG